MDHWVENYREEENNMFFKEIMLLLYSYFLEKFRAICEFRF